MDDLFIKFLKENGALGRFKVELKRDMLKNIERGKRTKKPFTKMYKEFLYFNPYSMYIMGGFTWSETCEGIDYWFELNEKWTDLIYHELKKIK